jgi:hypothetical protein
MKEAINVRDLLDKYIKNVDHYNGFIHNFTMIDKEEFVLQMYFPVPDHISKGNVFALKNKENDKFSVYLDHKEYLIGIFKKNQEYIKNEMKKLPLIANHLCQILALEISTFISQIDAINISMRNNLLNTFNFEEKKHKHAHWEREYSKVIMFDVEYMQSHLLNVIEKMNNQETLKHIKNYGLNFENLNQMINKKTKAMEQPESKSYMITSFNIEDRQKGLLYNIDYTSFETFDDVIVEVILVQKTKRFIQKTFSDKYRFLINDDTFNLIKELVMKNVSKTKFRNDFSKKMARYKNPVEFNAAFRQYIQHQQGWSIDQYVEKANKLNIDIIHNKNGILTLKIDAYEQSESIGSKQWCISYDQDTFHEYHGNTVIFFIYDFNKNIDDKKSISGVVMSPDNKIISAHWKNDQPIVEPYEYESAIPKMCNDNKELWHSYRWDYISSLSGKTAKNDSVIKEYTFLRKFNYMKKAIDENILTVIEFGTFKKWISIAYTRYKNHRDQMVIDDTNQWKKLIYEAINKKIFIWSKDKSDNMQLISDIESIGDQKLLHLLKTY